MCQVLVENNTVIVVTLQLLPGLRLEVQITFYLNQHGTVQSRGCLL